VVLFVLPAAVLMCCRVAGLCWSCPAVGLLGAQQTVLQVAGAGLDPGLRTCLHAVSTTTSKQ
jgi:hypothetical protein